MLSIAKIEQDIYEEVVPIPFVGSVVAAMVMVGRAVQIIITLVVCLLEIVTLAWLRNNDDFKEGLGHLVEGCKSFFMFGVFTIPLVGSFRVGGKAFHKSEASFNPFWLFTALGKALSGVACIVAGISFAIFGLLISPCKGTGLATLGVEVVGRGALEIGIGLAEIIPGVNLRQYGLWE